MDVDDQQRRILRLINIVATEALAHPRHERRAYVTSRFGDLPNDAREKGLPEHQAREFAAKLVEWTLSLIELIETHGGSAGGTA